MSTLEIFARKRISSVKCKQGFAVCFFRIAEENNGAVVENNLENRWGFIDASVCIVIAGTGWAGEYILMSWEHFNSCIGEANRLTGVELEKFSIWSIFLNSASELVGTRDSVFKQCLWRKVKHYTLNIKNILFSFEKLDEEIHVVVMVVGAKISRNTNLFALFFAR